jgi:hypothetical protein
VFSGPIVKAGKVSGNDGAQLTIDGGGFALRQTVSLQRCSFDGMAFGLLPAFFGFSGTARNEDGFALLA